MGARERDIAQAGGFIAPPGYRRHRPEATLLYRIVAEHYPSFRDRRMAQSFFYPYVTRLALGGRVPELEELNAEARLWCGSVANVRVRRIEPTRALGKSVGA